MKQVNERAEEPENRRAVEGNPSAAAAAAPLNEGSQEEQSLPLIREGGQQAEGFKTTTEYRKKDRDFDYEISVLRSAHPEVKELPQEVLDASVQEDSNVLAAYEQYRNRQLSAEVEQLRRENLALKQNAEAAARAPVTAVSSGGSIDGQEIDPFAAILSTF